MNPDIKKEWVAGLRSGKYTQGYGYLRSKDNKFCCLGLLCDIHDQKNEISLWNSTIVDNYILYDNDGAMPPKEVRDWCGVESFHETKIVFEGQKVVLCELNDRFRLDFNQIADLIEAQL